MTDSHDDKDNGVFSFVYSFLKVKSKANIFETSLKFLKICSKQVLFGYKEFPLVIF